MKLSRTQIPFLFNFFIILMCISKLALILFVKSLSIFLLCIQIYYISFNSVILHLSCSLRYIILLLLLRPLRHVTIIGCSLLVIVEFLFILIRYIIVCLNRYNKSVFFEDISCIMLVFLVIYVINIHIYLRPTRLTIWLTPLIQDLPILQLNILSAYL